MLLKKRFFIFFQKDRCSREKNDFFFALRVFLVIRGIYTLLECIKYNGFSYLSNLPPHIKNWELKIQYDSFCTVSPKYLKMGWAKQYLIYYDPHHWPFWKKSKNRFFQHVRPVVSSSKYVSLKVKPSYLCILYISLFTHKLSSESELSSSFY